MNGYAGIHGRIFWYSLFADSSQERFANAAFEDDGNACGVLVNDVRQKLGVERKNEGMDFFRPVKNGADALHEGRNCSRVRGSCGRYMV